MGGLEGIQTPLPCQRRHFHMGVCTQGEAGGGSRDGEDLEPQTPPPPPVALFLGWLCLLGASMNNDDVMMLAVAEASLSAGLPVSREQFSGFTAIPKPVLFLSSCYLWGN